MKGGFLLTIMAICLFFLFSCDRIKNELPETVPVLTHEVNEKPEITRKQEDTHQTEFSDVPVFSGNTDSGHDESKWDDPCQQDNVYFDTDILRQEVKDFSSYETHPLDRFLGKWLLLNHDGSIDERQSFIEIFIDGSEYRYYSDYFGSTDIGRLLFISMTETVLLTDSKKFIWTIVGKPFPIDDTWGILLDNEGPLGIFKREADREQ